MPSWRSTPHMRRGRAIGRTTALLLLAITLAVGAPSTTHAQSRKLVWSSYGRNAQHDARADVQLQPLQTIHWHTPVDLAPQYSPGGSLLIHYGSPLATRKNTIVVPV